MLNRNTPIFTRRSREREREPLHDHDPHALLGVGSLHLHLITAGSVDL